MKLSESEFIELKRQYTEDIKKTVIAFANDGGGKIYIGVENDGRVVGVLDADDVCLKVSSSIKNSIKPDIVMFTNIAIEKIDKKPVVVVTVQKGSVAPYYLAEKGLKPAGVFTRLGTSTVMATQEHIRRMIREADSENFIYRRSFNQELTFNEAKEVFSKNSLPFSESEKRTLFILREDGEYTNLGLLISDQCQHTIKVAVFDGTTKAVFKDRKEFSGSLFSQLAKAYEYIDLFNKTQTEFDGLKRVDKREYPNLALREALLNAIVHRDYAFSGSILLNLYDDRLEVVSIGGIVSGLTLEGIKNGVSQSRNDRLANIFYRLKLIEAYGTGIPRIYECYRESASKPIISATKDSFAIALPNLLFRPENNEADLNHSASFGGASFNAAQNKAINLGEADREMNEASADEQAGELGESEGEQDALEQGKIPKEQEAFVLEFVRKKGKIVRSELMAALRIGSTRSHNILSYLVRTKKLKEKRNGRKFEYFINN